VTSKNEAGYGVPPDTTGSSAASVVQTSHRPVPLTFGPFRLDFRSGQLFRGSEPVRLRPKTWDVLQYLVARPGVLVAKRELLAAVWPNVKVTEEVVGKSINELRSALGDSAAAPHLIETVPRRGVRFIGPVSDVRNQVSGVTDRSLTPGARHLTPDSDTRHPTPAPFVGRDQELQQLALLFGRASGGERQCVFITGEAGIGKTALVETFVDSLAMGAAPARVCTARGACVEQHGAREPYLPVLAALERLAQRPNCDRLVGLLRRVAPTWLVQMPWLNGDDEAQALRQVLQVVRPERMLREFAALVEALTTDVTLVLVLEDLHWSDASTVELLWMLAQHREPARLLLIGTFRPADAIVRENGLMTLVRTLAVRHQCVDIPLSQLREEDVRHYLGERFPGNDFPPTLATAIHRHTDGNPLFMIGVADRLLSRGDILDTAPGWVLRTPLETISLGVPDDVRLLIENDLDALSPADRSLLQAASVAGEQCTAIVVAAALGPAVGADSVGSLPVGSLHGSKSDRLLSGHVAAVETRCEALVQASRFLCGAGRVEWPGGRVVQRYAFVHELYRRGVYEKMPPGQRMRLHARIGRALEAAYGARRLDLAPQLAMHFEHGHDWARALRYLAAAAERARGRFANREAAAYLEAALALLPRLPDDAARRRKELKLRVALGATFIALHGFASEPVRKTFERAAELCVEVGGAAELFRIRYGQWYLHAMRGERDATIATVAELNGLARRLRTVEHRTVAASTQVRTAVYDGRFAEAVRLAQRRLLRLRVPEAAPAFAVEPVMASSGHAAAAMWFLGHHQRAQTTARAVVARARELGHFFTLAAMLMQAALVELLSGNLAMGGELAAESVALSAEHGFQFWNAMASIILGWALVQQERVSEGIATIKGAMTHLQSTGACFFFAYTYGFLADAYRRAGALADGLATVEAGLTVTQTSLDRGYAPELWRLKGELLQEQWKVQRSRLKGRSSKGGESAPEIAVRAEACFQRALELARASQAKSLELRAATSLARAWRARGRAAEARTLLAGVCRWFGAHATSADLAEARALFGQLQRPSTT